MAITARAPRGGGVCCGASGTGATVFEPGADSCSGGGSLAPSYGSGVAGNFENWRAVIEPLARARTVIAPDLPGHGESAPGGGDYSLGSLAAGLRDLLLTLGHDRATLVGHSLGGGIAMQFTYQFPEMAERLLGSRRFESASPNQAR